MKLSNTNANWNRIKRKRNDKPIDTHTNTMAGQSAMVFDIKNICIRSVGRFGFKFENQYIANSINYEHIFDSPSSVPLPAPSPSAIIVIWLNRRQHCRALFYSDAFMMRIESRAGFLLPRDNEIQFHVQIEIIFPIRHLLIDWWLMCTAVRSTWIWNK